VTSPFDVLGLQAGCDPTDDQVRSAWRRVAAATHPDRADGGDPAAFAAAASAYTALRTAAGRRDPVPARNAALARIAVDAAWRVRHGRPRRLAFRLIAAVAAAGLAVTAAGWQPATAAIITGVLTWLLLTGRADLALPRSDR
jgi:hypothetical protein